jgi:DNA polymerase-3 subunit alpha
VTEFVHLHVHTAYSLLDGAIRIKDVLDDRGGIRSKGVMTAAREMGMGAVAVTDHGNMFGALTFYEAALKAGLRPIVGCELYVAPMGRLRRESQDPRYHLVLLAQNETGYKNLIKLVTIGNLEGFYYKPRVDFESLEAHHEGLIALTACLSGHVPSLLLAGREEEALKIARRYARIFEGRFYLELQQNGLPEQAAANQGLKRLADELKLPLVATNDCHYLRREDAEAHDVLLCIQTGKTVGYQDRMRFPSNEYYFKSPREMADLFADTPEALANTARIAESCQVEIPTGSYHFPTFPLEKGQSLAGRLRDEARAGLDRRLAEIRRDRAVDPDQEQVYRDRLERELGVLIQMDFPAYFLIVADFMRYAREQKIPVGPGRGSGAGSLAAYALGITNIDPLPHGLLFERFLNEERVSMPDFDIDFCKNGREKVIQYVSEKYGGQDYVAQIITFGQMQARAVLRDVGRVLGLAYGEVDRIAKLIPNRLGITLDQALEAEPRLRAVVDQDPAVARLLEIARVLEGLPRHASTHAAGVVIGDRPLTEYLPLYSVTGGHDQDEHRIVVTQYDMKGVEKIGLIKFDFLGLRTLTLMDYALKLLKGRGVELDLDRLDLTDEKTYALLAAGDATGVFQFESQGMRDLLVRAGPNCFEDVMILTAIYRPGPLESGMLDAFLEGKLNPGKVVYELPELEPVLKSTYGAMLYQEQVMEIASRLADYSLGEADLLRRAMGKKKPEEMARQRGRFMDGVRKKGLDPIKSEKVFSQMEKFAGYGFNKSHTAAYALIAFQTAYLKAHYPLEFMAALLNSEVSNTDKIVRLINECRAKDLAVLPPDINQGDVDFTVVDGRIRFGLTAIKGLGQAAIEAMVEARASGPFTDLFDLCRRVDLRRVNRKVIDALIKSGAFDSTGVPRSQMTAALDEALEIGARAQRDRESGQGNLFESFAREAAAPAPAVWPQVPEWPEMLRLNYEKEALGFYISGHPLARYEKELAALAGATSQQIQETPDKARVRLGGIVIQVDLINTRKGDRMAFVTLEDMSGQVEVIVFPEAFQASQELLVKDQALLIEGEVTVDEKASGIARKIIANRIAALDKAAEAMPVRRIFLDLTGGGEDEETLLQVKDLLERHAGQVPVLLRIHLPNQGVAVLELPQRGRPGGQFLKDFQAALGERAVEFEYA